MQVSRNDKTAWMGGGFCLLVVLASKPVYADPGQHIRSGNTEITPEVQLRALYRTNAYLQEGVIGGGEPVTPGAAIEFKPSLELSTRQEKVRFNLSADWIARKYLTESTSNLDRFKDAKADAGLSLLPKSIVGVDAQDRFSNLGRESENNHAANAYLQHLRNQAQGLLAVQPGPALRVRGGYRFEYDEYSSPGLSTGVTPTVDRRRLFGPVADLKYRFLPKTAFVAEFHQYKFVWDNNFLDASGDTISGEVQSSREDVGYYIGIPDGTTWYATGGMQGRVTEKVSLGLVGGYGQMNYDVESVLTDAANKVNTIDELNENFGASVKGFPQGLVVKTQLRYTPREAQELVFAYTKFFEDVYFTNYGAYNDFRFRWNGHVGARIEPVLLGVFRIEAYDGEVQRTDDIIQVQGDIRYDTTPFMALSFGTWWTRRASADGLHPEIEYDDVNIHGGLTFTY